MNTCEIEHTCDGVRVHCYYGTDTTDSPYQIRDKETGNVLVGGIAFKSIPGWIKWYTDVINRSSRVTEPTPLLSELRTKLITQCVDALQHARFGRHDALLEVCDEIREILKETPGETEGEEDE